MSDQSHPIEPPGWRLRFGFFAGPVLWGLQLLAGYGLATVACNIADKRPEYILIGVSALIVLAAAILAYRAWQQWPGPERSVFHEANQLQRTRTFLAASGFVVSLLFFLLIVATLAIDIFSNPCPILSMPLP